MRPFISIYVVQNGCPWKLELENTQIPESKPLVLDVCGGCKEGSVSVVILDLLENGRTLVFGSMMVSSWKFLLHI